MSNMCKLSRLIKKQRKEDILKNTPTWLENKQTRPNNEKNGKGIILS